ncbi:MAG: hypothetical protein AAF939_15885 [Planctomycetota bacterium]
MKTKFNLAAWLAATSITLANLAAFAQDNFEQPEAAIQYEVTGKLLNSTIRNGIALQDLNGDQMPDLVVGSNAHVFDPATKTITARRGAGLRNSPPDPNHFQVSIHHNETKDEFFSVSNQPKLQVPISSKDLAVPPG